MKLLYGNKLIENQLKEKVGVTKIQIATAYISQYGIDILKEIIQKNNLSKNDVTIYTRYDFTDKDTHRILKQLAEIGNIYLIENLHAKAFYLQVKEDLLIYGSANLTYGGLMKNMEFYNIEEDRENITKCESSIRLFFERCKEKGKNVDEAIIEKYKEYNEARIEEMRKVSYKRLTNMMNTIKGKESYVETSEIYDKLNEFYFNKEDYEIFEEYHEDEDGIEITESRKNIKNKLLAINSIIKSDCENIGLYNHWNDENITSSISPNMYNHYKVNWLGVRFGRSKKEIDELNNDEVKNFSFHKYACMQFSISLRCFEIGIYHAVASDAVDRKFLRQELENNTNQIRSKIVEEQKKLKGNNLEWTIWSPYKEQSDIIFSLDKDDIERFPEFYLKNDNDGSHSSIMFRFSPNDERMKTKESISDLIMEKFKVLLPLYNTVIWKILK